MGKITFPAGPACPRAADRPLTKKPTCDIMAGLRVVQDPWNARVSYNLTRFLPDNTRVEESDFINKNKAHTAPLAPDACWGRRRRWAARQEEQVAHTNCNVGTCDDDCDDLDTRMISVIPDQGSIDGSSEDG